ncbi:MAG: hypothetical protein ACOCV8_00925 [Spirochaetota bacterium]
MNLDEAKNEDLTNNDKLKKEDEKKQEVTDNNQKRDSALNKDNKEQKNINDINDTADNKQSDDDKTHKEYDKTHHNNRQHYQHNQHNHKRMTNEGNNYNNSVKQNRNSSKYRNSKKLLYEALNVPIVKVAEKLGIAITSQNYANCINPSHLDNGTSMYFNKEKNRFECEVCGIQGSTIDMVRLSLNITKNKSAEWILDKVDNTEEYKKFIPEDRKKKNISKDAINNTKEEYKKTKTTYSGKDRYSDKKNISNKTYDKEKAQIHAHRDKLLKSGEMQKMYWTVKNNLMPISKIRIGISFLKDKVINTDTLDNLGIGLIVNPDGLEKELSKKFKSEDLVVAGLFKKEENKSELTFKFKEHNVIFPYISGRSIVFLQGRRIDNKEPVYMTTTPGQPFIYNFNILRNINEKQVLIICSDIVEAVSLIDKGFNVINVVNAQRFKSVWVNNIPTDKILLVTNDEKVVGSVGRAFLKNNINIRISDYNTVSITKKKDIKSIGEYFKKDNKKKDKNNDVPYRRQK